MNPCYHEIMVYKSLLSRCTQNLKCSLVPARVKQSAVLVCYSYLWHIPVTWRTSQGHGGSVWLRNKEVTFELPELLNVSSFDWIKLNLNETAYYRVNYQQSNWHSLANAIRRQHNVQIWLCVTSLS